MSIHKMSKEELLLRLDGLASTIPSPDADSLDYGRYSLQFNMFIESVHVVMKRKLPTSLQQGYLHQWARTGSMPDRRETDSEGVPHYVLRAKNFLTLLREWIVDSNVPLPVDSAQRVFRFMGTITDQYAISQEDHSEKRQIMKKGKQKYLWQFLKTTYGAEPQPLTAAEKYISEKLGRPNIKITKKDFENLVSTVSSFSTFPKEEVRKAFVVGEKIGLKKIDSI